MIMSDDPATRAQLHTIVKEEAGNMNDPSPKHQITAAAGSSSQLPRVEQELNYTTSAMDKGTPPSTTKHKPRVNDVPFTVILERLSEVTILKFTK